MSITTIIIIVTSIISYLAFNRYDLFEKFKFNPVRVLRDKQYYRLLTYGLLHSGWTHLLVNMFVLFSFGKADEMYLKFYFGKKSELIYMILYLGGLAVSNLYALYKYKNNYNYNAIGASGAVSAIVFASVVFEPLAEIYLFAILPIPGILFGIFYILYSYRMNNNNIAHDAHLIGAVFGFVSMLVLDYRIRNSFIDKLLSL